MLPIPVGFFPAYCPPRRHKWVRAEEAVRVFLADRPSEHSKLWLSHVAAFERSC